MCDQVEACQSSPRFYTHLKCQNRLVRLGLFAQNVQIYLGGKFAACGDASPQSQKSETGDRNENNMRENHISDLTPSSNH